MCRTAKPHNHTHIILYNFDFGWERQPFICLLAHLLSWPHITTKYWTEIVVFSGANFDKLHRASLPARAIATTKSSSLHTTVSIAFDNRVQSAHLQRATLTLTLICRLYDIRLQTPEVRTCKKRTERLVYKHVERRNTSGTIRQRQYAHTNQQYKQVYIIYTNVFANQSDAQSTGYYKLTYLRVRIKYERSQD